MLASGAVAARVAHATTLADLIECTKPGITKMVTITALVGYLLAATLAAVRAGAGGVVLPAPTLDLVFTLVGCVLGTAFSAAGANALNQWSERARDACM